MLSVYEELGEASRREILSLLRTGPKNVSQLVHATGLKQPNVSNHLSRMRARGIVSVQRLGREAFYTLASHEVELAVGMALDSRDVAMGARPAAPIGELVEEIADLACRGDEPTCTALLDPYLYQGECLLEVYSELLEPVMYLVGDWWEQKKIDVGQEHLASAVVQRLMARVVQLSVPAKRAHGLAVAGCTAHNQHELGLRMISDYLRSQGWPTLYLGANVPEDAFVEAVERHQPSLVLCSCCTPGTESDLVSLVRALRETRSKGDGFTLCIGGPVALQCEDECLQVGADVVGECLRTFARDILPRLATEPPSA